MAKLTSLESKFCVSEPQSIKSTVNFKVSDDLKASGVGSAKEWKCAPCHVDR